MAAALPTARIPSALALPGEELLERPDAVVTAGLPQRYLDDAVGHLVDKLVVVRGEEQVAGISRQPARKRGDALQVQMVGGLARSIGKKDKALESFRKAWEICPVKEKLAKEYALFLLESGNGAEALSVIENLKGSEREKFEYLSIRGRALALLGKDVEALESMLAANKIYDSDTDLLNDMGRLFLKIGNKEEAVKVLKASLKLKKEQPETEALLKSIQ